MKLVKKATSFLHNLYHRCRLNIIICLCFPVLLVLLPENGFPVNFSINPVRIFLDGQNKTNVLKIKNQSDEDISLQLQTFSWAHDSSGKNDYSPTKDIIFFPRILTIHKDEEKIIRIGTVIPQDNQEKTYRLFIEEIPAPDPVKSNVVNMVMKVGVPVFISPFEEVHGGSIVSTELLGGTLHLKVKNEGNAHFIVNSIALEGKDSPGNEIYTTEIGGWYLHGGKTKEYEIEIPGDHCHSIATLKVEVSTDNKLSFSEILNVTREMCLP